MREPNILNFEKNLPGQEEKTGPETALERTSSETEHNYSYLEGVEGTTELYRRVFAEHFKYIVPAVHFTNKSVGNDLQNLKDTGFIESFTQEGSKGNVHVGMVRNQNTEGSFQDVEYESDNLRRILESIREIAIQFMHHGRRTNKNSLGSLRGSKFSQPVAIIFDSQGKIGRGTDNYYHWIRECQRVPLAF